MTVLITLKVYRTALEYVNFLSVWGTKYELKICFLGSCDVLANIHTSSALFLGCGWLYGNLIRIFISSI